VHHPLDQHRENGQRKSRNRVSHQGCSLLSRGVPRQPARWLYGHRGRPERERAIVSRTVFPVQTPDLHVCSAWGVNHTYHRESTSTLRVPEYGGGLHCGHAATLRRNLATKLDVTVSSAGDARSLNVGLLLMTPALTARWKDLWRNLRVPLVLGGYAAGQRTGNAKVVNHPTTGRIPGRRHGWNAGVPLDLAPVARSLSHIAQTTADFRTAETHGRRDQQRSESVHLRMPRTGRRVDLHPQPGEDLPALAWLAWKQSRLIPFRAAQGWW